MLRNTYIHIPGIGASTELQIWKSGIKDWEDFLNNHGLLSVPKTKKKLLFSGIEESIDQLSDGNHIFFANRLKPRDHWRAYRHFKEKTAFFDIETTGLLPQFDEITMVGIYDGKETKTFIKGINLDEVPSELAKYKQLVTFNGARFDLPFIEREFPGFFNHLHVDLLYPLRRFGYGGGLKKIERALGIKRCEETEEITGFDAVRLWCRYERGDEEALDILIKYNQEDIVNLEKIIEMTYPMMMDMERKGLDGSIK